MKSKASVLVRSLTLLMIAVSSAHPLAAQTSVIKVQTDRYQAEIQPTMWGIFFEDINFAADGGIGAELIKNRSFEFSDPLMGWKMYNMSKYSLNKQSGSIQIINRSEENTANPHFARVQINSDSSLVISNEGFRGMGIHSGERYHFSLWARQQEGSDTKIGIALITPQGKSMGEAEVNITGTEWKKYTVSLLASATEAKANVTLRFTKKGIVDVDMISLFPQDTWKQRPNGLRKDLVQLLADMKPGFVRFPGGCIVEGYHLDMRYQWKKTIGAVETREVIKNRWNDEFKHRPAADYFQSFGVGFYEYFQLAEDIGASPLPIISCGMACQFNSAELVPLNSLDPYVQDALDLIEFANGTADSKWGKVRTQLGHPASFNLKFIGVGNEQWGPEYIERYKIFASAIQSKYPGIKIVSGTGPFSEGELFDYASKELKALKADLVDEHYYRDPKWFLDHADRYDAYDRSGPKIFAGEYAAQSVSTTSPENKNTWLCALSEAAFMTGLERNADVVHMASYAPLFAHAEGWQWTPDLIWFDNLNAYGTPSYYVQKMFGTNKGNRVLPILMDGLPLEGKQQLYASASWEEAGREVIIKVVNTDNAMKHTEIQMEGKVKNSGTAKQIILKGDDASAVNSFASPQYIAPQEKVVSFKGQTIVLDLPPQSFTILRVKMK